MEELRMMIKENPQFKVLVDGVEDKVYKKFEIYNRSEFETFANNLAKRNPQVNQMMVDIRNSFLKALNGESELLDI